MKHRLSILHHSWFNLFYFEPKGLYSWEYTANRFSVQRVREQAGEEISGGSSGTLRDLHAIGSAWKYIGASLFHLFSAVTEIIRGHQVLFECLEGYDLVGHAKTRRYNAAIFVDFLRIITYFWI